MKTILLLCIRLRAPLGASAGLGQARLLPGKLTCYVVLLFGETLIVLNVMVWFFKVPIQGNLLLLLATSLLFLLCALGLGTARFSARKDTASGHPVCVYHHAAISVIIRVHVSSERNADSNLPRNVCDSGDLTIWKSSAQSCSEEPVYSISFPRWRDSLYQMP